MPPRIRLRSLAQLIELQTPPTFYRCARCQYATVTAATTPVSPENQNAGIAPPLPRHSTLQPPSHRNPKYRRSQLLRSYVSLLQSTPLIVLFQHNNLRALEWASIRRELANALQKLDNTLESQGADPSKLIADAIKLQVVQTNMLEPALRIAEYYKPAIDSATGSQGTSLQSVNQSFTNEKLDPSLTHALSTNAYTVSELHKNQHPLTPLLTGSIALLTFPSVSPQHVKTALSILAPQAPVFPAPTRRAVPTYHEPAVQDGLRKLLLLGARIDGGTFDMEGTRWVGSIEGGIDGLRAQLVYMLQGFGAGLAQTLQGASQNLWFTMEGRRRMLDDDANPEEKEEAKQAS